MTKPKTVLVTGGLGFLGSALVRRLAADGACVRVLDSLLPQSGGNPRNLTGITPKVDVQIEDVRNRDAVNRAVTGADLVFHLAGPANPDDQASALYDDLDIACLGTWHVLEAIRLHAPRARLVYVSSAHVYAPDAASPVGESAPTDPVTRFGAHKLTAEKYVGAYRRMHGVDAIAARLTSVFGPRQRLQGAGFGTITRALESALYDHEVSVYNGGDQLHDLLYVADAADALAALGAAPSLAHGVVNVGSGSGVSERAMVDAVVQAVGRGTVRSAPRPAGAAPDGKGLVADVTRLRAMGVPAPKRTLTDALKETVAWYKGTSVVL